MLELRGAWVHAAKKKIGKENYERLDRDMIVKYSRNPSMKNGLELLTSQMQKLAKQLESSSLSPSIQNWIWQSLQVPLYHALGDAIGYKNGDWEFNYWDTKAGAEFTYRLLGEFVSLGGIMGIDIRSWKISDDTILYMSTLATLLLSGDVQDMDAWGENLRESYVGNKENLEGRHPGVRTMRSIAVQEARGKWDAIPYDSQAIGAGAAMRAGCLGLLHFGDLKTLILRCVVCSRITHYSMSSILGCVCAALFTQWGMAGLPAKTWAQKFVEVIESGLVRECVLELDPTVKEMIEREEMVYVAAWKKYISMILIVDNLGATTLAMSTIDSRYQYLIDNFSKNCSIPGGCADDALILAYDSLVRGEDNLEKVIMYSCLHPGDSDTVGCIALSWYGALYGATANPLIVNRLLGQLRELIWYPLLDEGFLNQFVKTWAVDAHTEY